MNGLGKTVEAELALEGDHIGCCKGRCTCIDPDDYTTEEKVAYADALLQRLNGIDPKTGRRKNDI